MLEYCSDLYNDRNEKIIKEVEIQTRVRKEEKTDFEPLPSKNYENSIQEKYSATSQLNFLAKKNLGEK